MDSLQNWSTGTTSVDGLTYHYERSGGADKPVLLMLHGLTDSAKMWTPVAHRLAPHFDIIMLDFYGHGRSQRVDLGRDNSASPANVLANIATALGLDTFGLLGHSMGASFAAQLAAAYPQRIRFAILEDPPWYMAEGRPAGYGLDDFRDWIVGLQAKTYEKVVEYGRSHHPLWSAADYPLWATAKLQFDPNFLKLVRPAPIPWQEQITQIKAPALLIYGDQAQGSLVSAAAADIVRHAWGANGVAHIPNSSHHVQRDQHEAFMQAVEMFLQNVSRS